MGVVLVVAEVAMVEVVEDALAIALPPVGEAGSDTAVVEVALVADPLTFVLP